MQILPNSLQKISPRRCQCVIPTRYAYARFVPVFVE